MMVQKSTNEKEIQKNSRKIENGNAHLVQI